MKEHDGRRFRSERTRAALIAACVAVLREGRVPTVEEIRTRARCSPRTVFWHFTTLANLHAVGLQVILGWRTIGKKAADSVSLEHKSHETRDEQHLAEHSL